MGNGGGQKLNTIQLSKFDFAVLMYNAYMLHNMHGLHKVVQVYLTAWYFSVNQNRPRKSIQCGVGGF